MMRQYYYSVVEDMLKQKDSTEAHGVEIELKRAKDFGGAGEIDPRCLDEMKDFVIGQKTEESKNTPSLHEIRKHMIGFAYNLNTEVLAIHYVEVETTCGKVPVWMYYPAKEEGLMPMILYVHGGAFMGGSVFSVESGCRLLAEKAHAVVCNIDYSLPPETPYPVPTTQIYESIVHFWENASSYGIYRRRIFIGGDSAGGNMSAAVAQMDRDKRSGYLAGEVLVYAKLVFANNLVEGYKRDLSVFQLVEEQMQYLEAVTEIGSEESNALDQANYVQGRYELTDPWISPMCGHKEGLPRTLMIQAEYDGLRLEGEYYAKQLKEAGVPVRCIRYCGVTHGFLARVGFLPQSEAAIIEIADFMNK